MTLTRRDALLGSLSLPVATLLGRYEAVAHAATTWPSPMIIAVTGIDPETSPSRLETVLEPFLAKGLALCIGVNPLKGRDARLEPRSPLAEGLLRIASAHPHLVEVGIHVDALQPSTYFALRQASDAQAAFTRSINRGGYIAPETMRTAATLLTSTPPNGVEDFTSLRAAGIRTIVHLTGPNPGQASEGGYWMTETGLAKVFDSGKNSTTDPKSPAKPRTAAPIPRPRPESGGKAPLILRIGIEELRHLDDATLHAHAAELAESVAALVDNGGVRSVTPHTLYTQSRQGPVRYVIVRVDDYRLQPSLQNEHEVFTKGLLAASIPVTEAVIPGGARLVTGDAGATRYLNALAADPRFEIAVHGLDHTQDEMAGLTPARNLEILSEGFSSIYRTTGQVSRVFIPPNNSFDAPTTAALGELGVPILSAGRGKYERMWGLDGNGILHVSNTVHYEANWQLPTPYLKTEEMLKLFDNGNDMVLMLHPQTVDTAEKKQQISELLKRLETEPGTELVNCGEYYDRVLPEIPELGLLQAARSRVVTEDAAASTLTPEDRRLLRQDAATAWEYFDRWWDKYDGLVPATAWEEYGKVEGYPFATMWDVASLIMANIAVHQIGFIDERRFEAAMAKVVKFLGQSDYRRKGVRLPVAERGFAKAAGARGGFDSADTGRLLIALKTLDEYSGQSLGIKKLVAGWDLQASIVDGEMCDFQGGRAVSVHSNAYAHYAARGYALWGVESRPVFDNPHPPGSVDSAMYCLTEMRKRGRIATEPHTTEEVELGASDAATAAADALLAAQIRRFDETGILTCVSEGPSDRPPWFTYQGYQIGPDGGTWFVDAPSEDQDKTVKRAGDSLRMVSAKGCFLWAATRPGAYSRKLLDNIREKARTNGFGFSVGTLETTGKSAAHADVNTNGIILEAISYMLNGRKPLLATGSSSTMLAPRSEADTSKS